MRTEAKSLINLIIEDFYQKLDDLGTRLFNQERYPHIVAHLVSAQQSLRRSLRPAEGCLVDAGEQRG